VAQNVEQSLTKAWQQVRALPARVRTDAATRSLVLAAVVSVVVAVVGVATVKGVSREAHAIVFANLSNDDATTATAALRRSNIPFRIDATVENGTQVLSVPEHQVYDARLLLASEGLPRASGVGFELFDKSDLGTSEFTQRVNLRRAVEGELSRTVGSLDEVAQARVHITLPEKRLFRSKNDSSTASASVLVRLHPGRTLDETQVRGIQHLVSAAIPELGRDDVTVIDGNGGVLSDDPRAPNAGGKQRVALERDLESRVVALLEPIAGRGAVVARVTAALDETSLESEEQVFDGDNPALRSEQRSLQTKGPLAQGAGVAGAAGNGDAASPAASSNGGVLAESEQKNFELSRTTTRKVRTAPRIERLSVAVLVRATDPARSPEELARLGELARRAVGFDVDRGDLIEVSSLAFAPGALEGGDIESVATGSKLVQNAVPIAAAVLLLAAAVAVALWFRRRAAARADTLQEIEVLSRGGSVAALEAAMVRPNASAIRNELEAQAPLVVPTAESAEAALLARAKDLARTEPLRAAHLVRAWLESDQHRSSPSMKLESAHGVG
jgi:flagellar M-ring protein FliF